MPSRRREARAPARRCAGRPASGRPRGSPAASARAAAVISESIRIPSHLSLPAVRFPALRLSHVQQRHRIEKTNDAYRNEGAKSDDHAYDRNTSGVAHGTSWNCSRRRKNSRGAATSWRSGGRSCPGFGSTRSIASRPTRGAPRWQTSSAGARSCWSTTSCSGPITRRAVRPARRSRTGSTASRCTWPTTTLRLRRCRGRRSRSCRPTSSGWAGRFPWASSFGSDFNFDFNVSLTEAAAARGRRRIQLPARAGAHARRKRRIIDEARRGAGRRDRRHDRYRRGRPTRANGPA